jgi:hypothetical protein
LRHFLGKADEGKEPLDDAFDGATLMKLAHSDSTHGCNRRVQSAIKHQQNNQQRDVRAWATPSQRVRQSGGLQVERPSLKRKE